MHYVSKQLEQRKHNKTLKVDWALFLKEVLEQYFYTIQEFIQTFYLLFILLHTKKNHDLKFQEASILSW